MIDYSPHRFTAKGIAELAAKHGWKTCETLDGFPGEVFVFVSDGWDVVGFERALEETRAAGVTVFFYWPGNVLHHVRRWKHEARYQAEERARIERALYRCTVTMVLVSIVLTLIGILVGRAL